MPDGQSPLVKPQRGAGRWIVVIIGGLFMFLGGGCALFGAGSLLTLGTWSGNEEATLGIVWIVIAVPGVVVFLIGLLVWRVATKPERQWRKGKT